MRAKLTRTIRCRLTWRSSEKGPRLRFPVLLKPLMLIWKH